MLGWQEEKAKQNNHKNIPTKQTYFTCSFCFTFHTYINWILVVYIPHMPHSPCLLPPFLEGSLLSKTPTLVQHHFTQTEPSLASLVPLAYISCVNQENHLEIKEK